VSSSSLSHEFPSDSQVSEHERLLAAEARLMPVTARPPHIMVRGSGSYVWDHTGKRYLDFIQGWAVNALGHAPKEIANALAAQAQMLVTASPAFYNLPQLELRARSPVQLAWLRFTCEQWRGSERSGAEARSQIGAN